MAAEMNLTHYVGEEIQVLEIKCAFVDFRREAAPLAEILACLFTHHLTLYVIS